jgi:Flp pilus assembly pilin Flp
MNAVRRLYLRTRKSAGGQTMAEYALILLAILVVVIAGYQAMGTTLKAEVLNIDGEM